MTESQRKDVLIAEDDEAIRRLIDTALTRDGLSCDTAADGVFAAEYLSANRYAVLLLDLMMPRLDGIGVLKELEASPASVEERPIVFVMTASPERSQLEEMSDLAHVVIRKPFDVTELTGLVRTCVAAWRQQSPAAEPSV